MAIHISIDLTGILEGILLEQKGKKKAESIKALRGLLDEIGATNKVMTKVKMQKEKRKNIKATKLTQKTNKTIKKKKLAKDKTVKKKK